MNNDIETIVEQAVRAALELSWLEEYGRWGRGWLDGSDRTRREARKARMRVEQWIDFRGETWAAKCCSNAAAAAEYLAHARETGAGWLYSEALSFANAAIRHAAYERNAPPERNRNASGRGPELVFDDWHYGPGGVRRGRSYGPGEV
jgi:hypothetical protein